MRKIEYWISIFLKYRYLSKLSIYRNCLLPGRTTEKISCRPTEYHCVKSLPEQRVSQLGKCWERCLSTISCWAHSEISVLGFPIFQVAILQPITNFLRLFSYFFPAPEGAVSPELKYAGFFICRDDTINSLRVEVRQKDDELRRCKTKVSIKYKITMKWMTNELKLHYFLTEV
jgi:hypothetical protein